MFSPRRRRGVIRKGPSSCFEVCRGESAENHSLSKEDCYWKHLPFFSFVLFRHSGLSGKGGRGGFLENVEKGEFENSAQFLKTQATSLRGMLSPRRAAGGEHQGRTIKLLFGVPRRRIPSETHSLSKEGLPLEMSSVLSRLCFSTFWTGKGKGEGVSRE
ncbi:hypothetical protein CEXT_199521 [Caerostris extrusa]|uniref:Uncharacterized protein n=1 Tax=Caerostris extrusa TaxID=172846 RepID=A0AAV4U9M3_CAEEX|nr:hypothetical protein CEXT_199521 [Caerostris extrusa]